MERTEAKITRLTYALTGHEVRQAIHAWMEDHKGIHLPIGIPLEVSDQGATLVWDIIEKEQPA
jgi:hypothetical protein